MSRSVCGWIVSCVALVMIGCPRPKPGGNVDPKSNTCSNTTSFTLNADSQVPFSFCTIADCPQAPEDQGDVVRRFCAKNGQATCTPCHCPEQGITSTEPEPRCKATEGPNPNNSKYVTRCEFERGNVENPAKDCTAEAPGRCTCTITVPKGDTLRCGCGCPPEG